MLSKALIVPFTVGGGCKQSGSKPDFKLNVIAVRVPALLYEVAQKIIENTLDES
jgi:hypothetical protein